MLFVKKGYICNNQQANCDKYRNHEVFFHAWPSHAICPSCEEPLTQIEQKRLNFGALFSWFIVFPGLVVASFYIKQALTPEPITGITFESAVSEVKEESAVALITVLRELQSEKPVSINYHTTSISASPNVDYEEKSGIINFEPNQTQANISIPIIPDSDAMESNETFKVTLTGLANEQVLTVVIIEKGVDQDLLDKADIVISELSVLSADLANGIATINAYENYFRKSLNPSEKLVSKFEDIQVSLRSARDRYLLKMTQATQLDPQVIVKTTENRLSVLQREKAELQYRSTKIMLSQLKEFRRSKVATTDSWIEELGSLIETNDYEGGELKSI